MNQQTDDIGAIVHARMGPVMERLETERRQAIVTYWKTIAGLLLATPILGGLTYAIGWFHLPHPNGDPGAAVMLTLVVMFVWLFVAAFIYRKNAAARKWDYIHRYKELVFGEACRLLFPDMRYAPGRGMSYEEFDGTKLFPHESDVYNSEDRLEGLVGKTEVAAAEITAERRQRKLRSDGIKTEYVQFFRGLFVVADFHKHFHSSIRVLPARSDPRPISGEEPVRMEDPEFGAEFTVLGTDQIDARYVLSTSMLRRILDLRRRWATEVRLAFRDSRVYMTLAHRHDWFEPSFYRSATDTHQVAEFAAELQQCLGIVEELNLNTRIWTKV